MRTTLPLVLAGLASTTIFATTFNVTTTTDISATCSPHSCSLRDAIDAANADTTATAANPHIINVPAGTYLLTILNYSYVHGNLRITNHMIIRGAGAATTIIDGGHLPTDTTNTGIGLIFELPLTPTGGNSYNVTARLEGLTVQNGNPAFLSWGNNVTLYQCVFKANTAGENGGYVIAGSSAVDGTSPQAGFTSTLTLDQTTVRDNVLFPGGLNIAQNGVVQNEGALTVTRSTIAHHPAQTGIGFDGTASIVNSTITGNYFGISDVHSLSPATVDHSTFNNIIGEVYYSNVTFRDSIIYGYLCGWYAATVNSTGYNLYAGGGTLNCNPVWQPTDRTVTQAQIKLVPLADNGGPTPTHRLLPGSTAIDTGTCTDISGNIVAIDQRGVTRPQDGNGNGTAYCDVGAYEVRTPETTVDALAAYNNGIKHGTLIGVGTGSQITANQATFLGYLNTADLSVHNNNYPSACAVLKTAVQASDGKPAQPDLITGSGLATFNALLVAVRTGLGC